MEFSITSETCRICLKKSPHSKLLSDQFGTGIPSTSARVELRSYLDIYKLVSAPNDFSMCPTNAFSDISSFFPQRICGNCEAQLVVAYEFRRKSIRSEKVLQNICSLYDDENTTTELEDNSTCVKEESCIAVEEDTMHVEGGETLFENSNEEVITQQDKESMDDCSKSCDDSVAQINANNQHTDQDYEIVPDTDLSPQNEENVGYVVEEFTNEEQDSEINDGDFLKHDLTSKQSLCADCGKFVSTSYLRNHRETHKTGDERKRPYECDQCQARFTLSENLNKHKRIHSNEKRYVCPYCQKQFLHWASRRYHISSHHTGEKRYTCEHCGAKFHNSSHYLVHIRRHNGVTPYACHLCDRSFITGNSLTLHLLSHSDTKNFHCDICKKSYKTAKSLRVHTKTTHEQEKNYVCPVCERAFSQNHVLRYHLLKNHPTYEPPPPGTVVNVRAVKRIREQLESLKSD